MKLHNRNVCWWAVSLACLGSLSCFRGIDATNLKCSDDTYCPSGYVCDIARQRCAAKGSIDALGSQEVGKGDGPRVEVAVGGMIDSGSGGSSGKLDAYGPPVSPDGAVADTPEPNTGGTGGVGGTGGDEGTGGTGGVEDTGGTGGMSETGGITTATTSSVGGTGGGASGGRGGVDAGGVDGTTARDAAPDSVDAFVPLPPGSRCTAGTQCASTFCADGVCCDTRCDGQCETCSAAGKCTLAPAGAAPASRTACPGSGICGSKCNGTARTCVYPTGTTCSDPTCTAGSATAAGVCSSTGTCDRPAPTPCGSGVCGSNGLCADQCTETSCPTGYYCNSAKACAQKKSPGAVCANSNECGSTAPYCADGVCCRSDCTQNACTACNTSGNCVAVTGTPRTGHPLCTTSSYANCSGTCDGTNLDCTYPPETTLCTTGASYTCDTSTYLARIPPKTCNGAGDCNAGSPAAVSCGTGNYCSGNTCTARGVSGAACTAGGPSVQCASGLSCVSNNSGGNRCCPSGQIACSGVCTDPTTGFNCGSCGTTCGANQSCKSLSCQCDYGTMTCSNGTTSCNSENFDSGSSTASKWSLLPPYDGTATLQWTSSTHNGSTGALSITYDSMTASGTSYSPGFKLKYMLCPSGRTPVTSVSFDFYSSNSWINEGSYVAGAASESDMSSAADLWTDPNQQYKTGSTWYPVNVTISPTYNAVYLILSLYAYWNPDGDGNPTRLTTTILIDNLIVR